MFPMILVLVHTQSMLINVNPWHYGCRLDHFNEFFLRNTYIPGVDIALAYIESLYSLRVHFGCFVTTSVVVAQLLP